MTEHLKAVTVVAFIAGAITIASLAPSIGG